MLQPRFVRFRDAPDYLGMDRNRFNAEVRPYLTEIPIGTQGLHLIDLILMPGRSIIRTATVVPIRKKEL